MKPSEYIDEKKKKAFKELPNDRPFQPLADLEWTRQAEIKAIVEQMDELHSRLLEVEQTYIKS